MGPATASLHILRSMQKTLSILAVLHISLSAAESLQNGTEFDCIVIGGGAVGGILASRLSENPNIIVALLVAGEEPDMNMEPNNFPKVSQGGDRYGFSTYKDDFSAQYIQDENVRVIAEEFTGGATPWVHMMHLRGHPNDYQGWADAAGDNSWNYENMLRYFIRSEQVKDQRTLDSSVTGYGTEGTLNLTRESSDANRKIIQAFEELGYEYHLNLNATLGITEPFYYMSEGQFQSIYQSYIVPARNRSNLFIYPNTTATLIRFDDDQTATGVQAYNSEDTYVEVRARREIILADGVIKTPQIMLLSGIGPAADLNDWSIPVVSDLPVGEGLSDCVGAIVAFILKEFNDSTQTSNDYMAPTTVAFKALDPSQDTPDYQVTNHIFSRNSESLPKLCVDSYQYKAEICEKLQEINSKHELMFSIVSITRPQSTGFMALNSLDMFDHPFIYMGYFAETADSENLAAYLEDVSNIVNTENFRRLRAELVDFELPECGPLQQNSQDYWMCYGQYMSTTTWNVVGTAQMGDVLDSNLNVRGVQKLRVVDPSAIPFAHSGYLLPSTIAMAERGADLILNNVEISNLVTDVSEEDFSASEEDLLVSEESSLAFEENESAQGLNNSNENEDFPRSENGAVPSSENVTTTLYEDEEGSSTFEESSSPSDENASAQGSNDSDTESSLEPKENASAQETNNLDENGVNQGSHSSENEAAPSSKNERGSSASEENKSAQGSNDLDEEITLDSQGNVSAQETNGSNDHEDSENEAALSSGDEPTHLSENEEGPSASEASFSSSDENASAQRSNDSETESSLETQENASALETNELDEDFSHSETQGSSLSENEAAPASEDKQGSSASNKNASAQGSNDLDKESSLDSQGNVSAQETNNLNENEDSPQSENEAAPSSEDEAALLSKDQESSSASEQTAPAQRSNDSAELALGSSEEDGLKSEGEAAPTSENEESLPSLEKDSSESEENSLAQRKNDSDDIETPIELDDANNTVTDDKAEPALEAEDAALSYTEGETQSEDDVFVPSSNISTSEDETTSLSLSANSTLNVLKIRAAAHLLRSMGKSEFAEVAESLESDEEASLSSETITNSMLDVGEEAESQLISDLVAHYFGGSESESVNETVSTGGLFEIANITAANSTLNALEIRAVARLLKSMGKFAAEEVDGSFESDEAASLASEIVTNSTLDVNKETESQRIAVLVAHLLRGSDIKSVNETVSTGVPFEIANKTAANSTLNTLDIRVVARLLESIAKFAADGVDGSLESDEAASLASEIVANSTLEVKEDTESERIGVLVAHLLRGSDSESKNETETVSGQSGSEGEGFEDDVFVPSSNISTSEDETTSLSLSANSTLNVLKIRAAAHLLRSMGKSEFAEVAESLESDEEASLSSETITNSMLDVGEEAESQLISDLAAHYFGGSESESVNETVSTGGLFEIANITAANSTLNALEIRAVARLLKSMGKFVAEEVDGSFESDEAASLASEIVTNSTLDVNKETESQRIAVLVAHLLRGSNIKSVNETVSTGGPFEIANKTAANSTLNALDIRVVARLLKSIAKFAADGVDGSLESDEAASLASEIVANSTLEVKEDTESERIGVLVAHLLRGSDSESKNETETVSGRSGSEGEGSEDDDSDQAAENETNSTSETQANPTLDALKGDAVARMLGSMGSSGSDEEESVLGSELTELENNEEAKSGLSAVIAVHLLGDSESKTKPIRDEASNGWLGSNSEPDKATGLFGSGTANNNDEKEKSNLGRHYLRYVIG